MSVSKTKMDKKPSAKEVLTDLLHRADSLNRKLDSTMGSHTLPPIPPRPKKVVKFLGQQLGKGGAQMEGDLHKA
jgi:hypothetical protein